MWHTVVEFLMAGTPPHYCYAAGAGLLLTEDLIARSRLKANSTIQLAFQLLGYVPGIGAAMAKLGPKS